MLVSLSSCVWRTQKPTHRRAHRLISEKYESGKDFIAAMQRARIAVGGAVRRITQTQRVRGGHGGGGGWWAEGTQEGPNGVLFNETPPPPGQARKWEDWELPYYATGILTTVLLTVGLSAKPDTRIETWAHKQALERLAAEELS